MQLSDRHQERDAAGDRDAGAGLYRPAWRPSETPLGRTIAVGQGGFHDAATVVGVVANVRYRSLEMASQPDVYIPVAQLVRWR